MAPLPTRRLYRKRAFTVLKTSDPPMTRAKNRTLANKVRSAAGWCTRSQMHFGKTKWLKPGATSGIGAPAEARA